ncbi:unnamed protein product [Vicia faba]|uniref:SWIM-type domain-containing protein n=1 Tax=Vicia faba TaxID=3906 RepID=A0AAV1ADP5_VICFA|nr:unnamed protein product [Vicia faba]
MLSYTLTASLTQSFVHVLVLPGEVSFGRRHLHQKLALSFFPCYRGKMEITECLQNEIEEPKDIFLGQIVSSKDQAYDLYQEHAFKMGFSVRKGRELYHDNEKKKTRLKEFYCSKQGFKNNEPDGEVAYKRPDSRTNCLAMVRFNVTKEGVWKVTKLILDHNHEFVPLGQRYLLRSMRNLSNLREDRVKSLVNDAIKVTSIGSYLGEEVGGFKKHGVMLKDMRSYVCIEKLKCSDAKDAQSVLNHLQIKQAQDSLFYYSVQLDQESRLTNVFWRDGKSKVDYSCFGDVVVFDTTCLKFLLLGYSRRFWRVWKTNNQKQYLHLMIQPRLKRLESKCMEGCDSEEEFQRTWDEMMNVYKLQDHQWLSNMYEIRHKWSIAYSKCVFSAGIKSCQRIESTNSVLGEIVGKTTTLAQFLVAFEKMLKKWRHLEVEEEFKNNQSTPPLVINISETLRHASTVYTHKTFNLFLNEYLEGTGGSTSIEIGHSDSVSYHEVMLNHMPDKKYAVTFDSSNMKISCSCHKFDSMGILCSHALRIYNIKGILRIPYQYFLQRWSKNARSVIYEHINRGMGEDSTSNSVINVDDAGIRYRNAILKSFYSLVLESQDNKEAQKLMWKLLDIGVERVQKCVGKVNLNSNEEAMEKNFNEIEEICCTPMV